MSCYLLNKKHVRDFILAKIKSLTPANPITRVSQEALDSYEARLRNWIVEDVRRHPTIGKTFKETNS